MGVVGSKSSSLSKLGSNPAISGYASTHGGAVMVPGSSALPFSAFGRAIGADAACLERVALAAAAVAAADDVGDAYLRREALKVVRDTIVYQLTMPADLDAPLAATVAAYGGGCTVDSLWIAIKKVWASKWNERAFLSRKACGVEEEDLYMATLLMEVVPAEMAFVLHTANPITGNTGEVFGEVCIGLGEALVGNDRGEVRGLSHDDSQSPVEAHQPPPGDERRGDHHRAL